MQFFVNMAILVLKKTIKHALFFHQIIILVSPYGDSCKIHFFDQICLRVIVTCTGE